MLCTSRTHPRLRGVVVLVLVALLALSGALLVGCKGDTPDIGSTSPVDKTIRIGWIPWDEDIAVTYLWKQLLEEAGYKVELTQLDAGPVFEGLAASDLDLFFDAWLPSTHEDYFAQYGDRLEQLGVWYDNGLLTWAVPNYVDIDSIEDLVGREAEFGGRVIGIEPGAGLTRVSLENVIPDYALDGYELVEGSTPAMLAELERATRNEDGIVVTLWRPHWAYAAFDMKDLADPKGSLGTAEEIHTLARKGFSSDHAEVARWIGEFTLDDDALASLTQMVIQEYGAGEEEAAVNAWLEDAGNRALADGWMGK